MKSHFFIVAMFLVLAQGASACDVGQMHRDVDFLTNDAHAQICMNYYMKQQLLDGWTAMGTCNEHANFANLNSCYQHPVCDYLREKRWTPACPGLPLIRRHGRHHANVYKTR